MMVPTVVRVGYAPCALDGWAGPHAEEQGIEAELSPSIRLIHPLSTDLSPISTIEKAKILTGSGPVFDFCDA